MNQNCNIPPFQRNEHIRTIIPPSCNIVLHKKEKLKEGDDEIPFSLGKIMLKYTY
jgi:hypothetical protein